LREENEIIGFGLYSIFEKNQKLKTILRIRMGHQGQGPTRTRLTHNDLE